MRPEAKASGYLEARATANATANAGVLPFRQAQGQDDDEKRTTAKADARTTGKRRSRFPEGMTERKTRARAKAKAEAEADSQRE
jgi:hypothetical protein